MTTSEKILPVIFTVLLTLTMYENPSFAKGETKAAIQAAETDRVIVKMKNSDAARLKMTDNSVMKTIDKGEVVSVKVPEGQDIEKYIEELKKSDDVEIVEEAWFFKVLFKYEDDMHLSFLSGESDDRFNLFAEGYKQFLDF